MLCRYTNPIPLKISRAVLCLLSLFLISTLTLPTMSCGNPTDILPPDDDIVNTDNDNNDDSNGSDDEAQPNQPKASLPLLVTMKDWVLTHAPHHKYNPETDEHDIDENSGRFLRKSGSTCHSIRFLCKYHEAVSQDKDVFDKITNLSDFILSMQYTENPNEGHYGAFIKNEGDTDGYHYATNASHCAEALLLAYQTTKQVKYKTASIIAADFLIRMQHPTLGGIYEYYNASSSHPMKNRISTKLLMALPLFKMIYEETGEEKYNRAGIALRSSILTYGLENGYEYYLFDWPEESRAGDNLWHRDKSGGEERYMYGDSASFAVRGIYEYEGHSEWLESVYEFYNSFTGGENAPDYNPDICWAGYLSPEIKTINRTGTGYYDMINIGILMPYRMQFDVEAYELSRQMMFDNPEAAMFWGLRLSYELEDIEPWQNNITISNIAEGLVQTNPYEN